MGASSRKPGMQMLQDWTGPAVTFDQNGGATGQMNLPTYSWLGNAYQVGSVEQVVRKWFRIAQGFSPLAGANYSGNFTSVMEDWFPFLDHCTTTPGCIGPSEAIYNALDDLKRRLNDPAVSRLAQTEVFDLLGNDASGKKLTTASFVEYLTAKRPGFFDGLRSYYCKDALDAGSLGTAIVTALFYAAASAPKNSVLTSVQYYLTHPQMHPTSDAVTATPGNPLLVFFRASSVLYPSLGKNLGNEGLIFHEALHGFTGKGDGEILQTFGWKPVDSPSCNISRYIEDNVLSKSPYLDSASTTAAQCPAGIPK